MGLENCPVGFIFLSQSRLNKSDDLSRQGAPKEGSTALQNLLQLIFDIHGNALHFTPFCSTLSLLM